jgi:predicted nucleic acid-binding protein
MGASGRAVVDKSLRIVVDCSVTLGFFRRSQATQYSDLVLATAPQMEWRVPTLWRSEFANALLSLERRKLTDARWRQQTLAACAQLPFVVDAGDSSLEALCELSSAHGLTAYDAQYLACAMRHDIPLATQDTALSKAARKCRLYFDSR